MTTEERKTLVDVSWRYAALIGILNDDSVGREIAEEDRLNWPHLVTGKGIPLFDEKAGLDFMKRISGLPHADCLLVLRQQWMAEHCSSCNCILWPITDHGVVDDVHAVDLECEGCGKAETRKLDCFGECCPWCECGK
jgi:hypothetical protein